MDISKCLTIRFRDSNSLQLLEGIPTTAQKPVAEIYNVTGGLISKHQLKGIDNNIDVSMLSNGFYLIKVKTRSQVIQKKLQIIK